MKKDLAYYTKLPYTIELVPISESEGGGFIAQLPQVGRFAITGHGETPEKAIAKLEKVKRERFAKYLKKGVTIPEPEPEKEEYSGRFIVRLPKILHYQLVAGAKQNQSSLNQYVTYLLALNFHLERQERQFDAIKDELEIMSHAMWHISYSVHFEELIEEQIDEEIAKIEKQDAIPRMQLARAA